MELLEAIKKRRSIRKFKQLKVDDSILAELIDAARLAPCGGNMQQLRYIVIREPELIKKIFEITAWAGHVQPKRNPVIGVSAPTAFIAITSSAKNPPHADAGAAIQNMMLRGLEFDLGFCWIGAFKPQKANEILGLPEGIRMNFRFRRILNQENRPSIILTIKMFFMFPSIRWKLLLNGDKK
jgi:nitroreductase